MRRPNVPITVTAVMDHQYGELRPISPRYAGQTITVAEVRDQWNEAG